MDDLINLVAPMETGVPALNLFPRHLANRVRTAMADTPAVLVNGPRQCGKTTLVRQHAPTANYYSLDDASLLASVQADPMGFVRQLDTAIIDEVQRAPQLLAALKLSIDNDRRPGRFLLTGSVNLLTLPTVSDSLAGRMEVLTLLPLSQAEVARRDAGFLSQAMRQEWAMPEGRASSGGEQALIERVLTGGYPEMRQRPDPARRVAWANAYLKALVQRDLPDFADASKLEAMPRLLAVLAHMAGQLTNFVQIGAQLGLDSKTVQKYVGLLEQVYLVVRVPPWSRNELGRLIKTPKLHFVDAGLQSSLRRLTLSRVVADKASFGPSLETWVFGELLKLSTADESASSEGWVIHHFRDKDQVEVDFVLENASGQVLGFEVKASATVQASDFKGLRRLASLAGSSFVSGVVLYDGEHVLPFGEGLWAVPLTCL